jgi:hypothetical protein
MDKAARNKKLIEAMGGCWHESSEVIPYSGEETHTCKCGASVSKSTISPSAATRDPWDRLRYPSADFSSWDGFGRLWAWAKQQNWWEDDFWRGTAAAGNIHVHDDGTFWMATYNMEDFINPDVFADAVYSHLMSSTE